MRQIDPAKLRAALTDLTRAGAECTGDGEDVWGIRFRELGPAATQRLQRRWGVQDKSPADYFLWLMKLTWSEAAETSKKPFDLGYAVNLLLGLYLRRCQWLVANAHEIVSPAARDQQRFGGFARAFAVLRALLDEYHPTNARLDLPADVALDVLRPTLSYLVALRRKAVALSVELKQRLDAEGCELPTSARQQLLEDSFASLDEELRVEFARWFTPAVPVITALKLALEDFEYPQPDLDLRHVTAEVCAVRYGDVMLSRSAHRNMPFGDVAFLGLLLQLVSTVAEVVLEPTDSNSALLGRGKLLGALIRNFCGCLARTYGPVTGVRSIDIVR